MSYLSVAASRAGGYQPLHSGEPLNVPDRAACGRAFPPCETLFVNALTLQEWQLPPGAGCGSAAPVSIGAPSAPPRISRRDLSRAVVATPSVSRCQDIFIRVELRQVASSTRATRLLCLHNRGTTGSETYCIKSERWG
jgi:hypothetical protein